MYGAIEFYETATKSWEDYVKKIIFQEKNEDYKRRKAENPGLEEDAPDKDEIKLTKEDKERFKDKFVKPLIGCEFYTCANHLDNTGKQETYHLVLIAKNLTGYYNLCKLNAIAWTEGYYYHPRIDRKVLREHSEGLICLTACIAGEIPRKIIQDRLDEAEEAIQWYKRVFGDNFYLELQRHKATVARANHEAFGMQQKANEKLIEYARKFDVKLVHYLTDSKWTMNFQNMKGKFDD